ncbi:YigZ family protein [Peptostreptococcaceae bacterium AGR-M142]
MKLLKYNTVHQFGQDEIIIEKSRFIGYCKPVKTEEEARAFIDEIKTKHKDATHNVWAYTIGLDMNIQRYSDDGEPSGTAGIPTLEVIKKEDLRDVVVVVTRYFGGIKLGAGGLVRAYTKGAKIGLEASNIVQKKMFQELKINIDYTNMGKIQNFLMNENYYINDTIFEDKVCIIVYCEIEEVKSLVSKLIDLTNAKVDIIENEEFYISCKDGELIFS